MKSSFGWFFFISLLVFPNGYGQQQEAKLLDRIERPDMRLGNPLQSKSFGVTSGINMNAAFNSQKSFGTYRSGGAKDFPGSRSFLGIKNPWFGKLTYDAKTALLAKQGGVDALKPYDVKMASTSSFALSPAVVKKSENSVPTKPFLVQGKADGSMQQLSEKVRKEMTIDEVRELLNKPR